MGLFSKKKDQSMSQTAWSQYAQDVLSRNKFLQDTADTVHQNDPYYAEMEGDVGRINDQVDLSNRWLNESTNTLDQAYNRLGETEGDFGRATDTLGRAESDLQPNIDELYKAEGSVGAGDAAINETAPFLRQFYEGDLGSTPFYKAMVSKGTEGVNRSYDDALAATRRRAALSGFGTTQPITNFAQEQQDVQRAHELGILPRDALLASVEPGMKAVELRNAQADALQRGASLRTGIASGFGDVARTRADIGRGYTGIGTARTGAARGYTDIAGERANIAEGVRAGGSLIAQGAGIRGNIAEERLQGAGVLNNVARSYDPAGWYQTAAGQQTATNAKKGNLISSAIGIGASLISPMAGGLTKKLFDRFRGTPSYAGSLPEYAKF